MGAVKMQAVMVVVGAALSGCMGVFYPHPWPLEASVPSSEVDDFAPDAPVVMIRRRVRLTYVGEGTGVFSPAMTLTDVHEVLRIQKPSGLEAASLVIPYPLDALDDLEAIARRPDGRVVRVGPEDAVPLRQFEPSGTSGEPTDVTVLLLPEVTVGSLIELRFRASEKGWRWEQHVTGYDMPTLEWTVLVTRPERLVLNYISPGFSRESRAPSGGYAQDVFELRRWKPGAGRRWAGAAPQPELTLSQGSVTWPNGYAVGLVAGWEMAAAYLWSDYRAANAQTPRGPTKEVSTHVREAMHELSAWVQQNVAPRTSLDQRGLRQLSEVVASGYGNELERALVLYSLLEGRHVPGLGLVVIPPSEDGTLAERVATYSSVRRGDFLVRAVLDGQDIFLDPSCLGCWPGEISPHLWRREAVALQPTGRVERIQSHGATTRLSFPSVDVTFLRTPEAPSLSAPRTELSFELSSEGLRLREGRWRFSGSRAAPLRSWAADSPGAPLDDPQLRRLVDDYAPAPSVLESESDGVMALIVRDAPVVRPGIVDTARRVVLPLGALDALPLVDAILTTSISATQDVRLPARLGLSLSTQLTLGPNDRLRTVPEPTHIVSDAASYTRTASVVGSTLSVTEALTTSSQVLPREGRAAFLDFLAKVRAARRAAIVVDRAPTTDNSTTRAHALAR
jgi:hypothetical protein